MSRAVPEWIAKRDDDAIPPRVRLRVFERAGGKCHISGRAIRSGEAWECDHIVALVNGGQHRESNLAPALAALHKLKTADDVAEKSRVNRKKEKHLGIRPKRRGFYDKTKFKAKIGGGLVDRRTGLPANFKHGVRDHGSSDRT